MIQVKFFVETVNAPNLEEQINDFLFRKQFEIEVVDIKYNRPHATNAHAMLIYKTK